MGARSQATWLALAALWWALSPGAGASAAEPREPAAPAVPGDTLVTKAGERLSGTALVLSGGRVSIELAGRRARTVPVAEVEAFTVTGKRTLTTADGDTIAVTRASLAGGEVSFESGLGRLSLPAARVKAIEFPGWKAHYARLTGGFIDRSGKAVEQKGFGGTLALGYAATSGTVDTSSLSLSLDGSSVRGPWQLKLSAKALVAEAEDEKTSDLKEAAVKLDRYVNPRTYAYLRSAAFRDTVTDLRLRLNAGGGLGRRVLALDEHVLSCEAGAEYQYERVDPDGSSDEIDEGAVWRAALSYAWKISPRATFTQEAEMLGHLEGPSRIRSRTVSALSAKVAGNMLMKFGFTWEYDDAPPEANEHSEFRFESALVISF